MDKEIFLEEASSLIEEINEEIEKPKPERDVDVQISDLDLVLTRIYEMRKRVESDKLPPHNQRHKQLTRLIMDQWPLGTSLGNRVMKLEKAYCDRQ